MYSLWYEQKEDVLRTYTNKMPERIPLEQQKKFKTIRNDVVQAAMQLYILPEEIPLSDPVPPRVDFVDDGSDVYPKAVRSLREPEVKPSPEAKQFLHEAAIRGSVDAVYGVGKFGFVADGKAWGDNASSQALLLILIPISLF